eukprot:scaffold22743_cov73-Cylindrotheca_fusiformis.AAC.1
MPSPPMLDMIQDSEYGVENPPEKEEKLSRQSQIWDTDNKGYLSKAERVAKELDMDGKGYLNQEEARSLGRKIVDLSDENIKIRRLLCGMALLVIILCAATIPAAYFAITGHQETKVDDNGRLVSTNGGAAVSVKTQGIKVNTYRVEGTNSTKTCVRGEDLANVWIDNQNGGVATIVIQNEDGYEQVLRLSPSDSRMTQDVVAFGDVELYPDDECDPDGSSSGAAEDGNRRLREYVRGGEGGRQLGMKFFHYHLSDNVICYY